DAIGDALPMAGAQPMAPAVARALEALLFEGYVAGRHESVVAEAEARAAAAVPILTLGPRCLALVPSGDLSANVLAGAVERFGVALLKSDARACVVDVSHLAVPSPERAAELFGADAAARMLGAPCFFAGASDAWLDAAREGRVPLEVLRFEPSFP